MGVTVGVMILPRGSPDRATELAAHLRVQGTPVVMVCGPEKQSGRWPRGARPPRPGSWAEVAATLDTVATFLAASPELSHVCLISGACLPLRPMNELRAFLAAHRGRDFIESVDITHVDWKGRSQAARPGRPASSGRGHQPEGPASESPLKQLLTRRRGPRVPDDITLCCGAEWWCLSRATLVSLLGDPELPCFKRYFRPVGTAAEGFFQTLARRHSWAVAGHNLTWSVLDRLGQPVTLYDDHIPALAGAPPDRFFAHAAWQGADDLYHAALSGTLPRANAHARQALTQLECRATSKPPLPQPGIPRRNMSPGTAPYTVIVGAEALFPDLGRVLKETGRGSLLGRVFENRPDDGIRSAGGLAASVPIARANPSAYIANLLRNAPGHPVIVLRPGAPPEAMAAIARDRFARIVAIKGAWTIPLHRNDHTTAAAFAATQRAETRLLAPLNCHSIRAEVATFSLEEAAACPDDVARALALPAGSLVPACLSGLPEFLDQMRSAGMAPEMSLAPNDVPAPSQPGIAAE